MEYATIRESSASALRRLTRWATQSRLNRQVVGLVAVAALLFGPGTYQWIRLSWMQWRLDRQLGVLAAEQDRLTRERGRLQSDPAHVEGLIRSTFKWAKQGEYVIPLDPAARRDAPSSR